MKKGGESYFWTSYSDMMTSLFFIMLILFVLTIVLLHNRMEKIEIERGEYKTELKNIRELQESILKIDKKYFEYNAEFNRFTLKNVSVKFATGSADINDVSSDDLNKLKQAGMAILTFMFDARKTNDKAEYIVIIEGQASMDNYKDNDALSYRRALALYDYWTKTLHYDFDATHCCEVIISGSGTRSKFREPELIDGKKNEANQRFVIHIIPKLSEMNSSSIQQNP